MCDECTPTVEIEGDDPFGFIEYNIENILNNSHQIFLYNEIDEMTTKNVCQKMVAFDNVNLLSFGDDYKKYVPITLRIWSPGGYVTGGISIIDTMHSLATPVITVVIGQAASMASLVLINGDYRLASRNSSVMFHPMSGGIGFDYLPYERDNMVHTEKLNNRMLEMVKSKTKLGLRKNKKLLDKSENGVVWLDAEESLSLGIIDQILDVCV